jgi:hypothetical protein
VFTWRGIADKRKEIGDGQEERRSKKFNEKLWETTTCCICQQADIEDM